jgi:hypothetical protein
MDPAPPPDAKVTTSYRSRVVAFLDILGFSAMTRAATTEAETTIQFIDEHLRSVILEKVEHSQHGVIFDVRLFSDCICLVSEHSAHGVAALLDSVAYLSLAFAVKGIPLRGGVAAGRHFHSDHMIFSEALVAAYGLESQVAKWPRTVVAADVIALAREEVPFLVRHDSDDQAFVDYLEYCSEQDRLPAHPYDDHKAFITAGLAAHAPQAAVRAKYEWLGQYHNEKLNELAKQERSKHVVRDRMFIPGL